MGTDQQGRLNKEIIIRMRNNVIYSVLGIILMVIWIACSYSRNTHTENEYFVNGRLPKKDSIQIFHTLRAWYNMGWFSFENYDDLYVTNGIEGQLTIEGFFSNADTTKMIVWICEKLPNYRTISDYSDDSLSNMLCPGSAEIIYSMYPLVGIRDNSRLLWRLYPLELISVHCSSTKEKVLNTFKEYFFSEMANSVMYVRREVAGLEYGGRIRHDLMKNVSGYQEGTNEVVLKELGYNLQDTNFWEKSLIWQKGSYLDGYCSFQVWGKDTLKIPEITYPDSLLKLFQETKSNPD